MPKLTDRFQHQIFEDEINRMILTFWRSVFVWSAVTVPLQMKTILLLRQQFEENLFKTNQKIGFLYLQAQCVAQS